jgi:hypothetical protein
MHPWGIEPDGNSAAGPKSDLGPAHLLMAVTMVEGAHSHKVHLDTQFYALKTIIIANSPLFAYFPILTLCVIQNTLHPLTLFGCVRLCCHTGLGYGYIQALWHFFVQNQPPSPTKGLRKKNRLTRPAHCLRNPLPSDLRTWWSSFIIFSMKLTPLQVTPSYFSISYDQ